MVSDSTRMILEYSPEKSAILILLKKLVDVTVMEFTREYALGRFPYLAVYS